eukprot:scaffold64081_cov48-Attheya_sp.AAC.3
MSGRFTTTLESRGNTHTEGCAAAPFFGKKFVVDMRRWMDVRAMARTSRSVGDAGSTAVVVDTGLSSREFWFSLLFQ